MKVNQLSKDPSLISNVDNYAALCPNCYEKVTWLIRSNIGFGDGFCDILIESDELGFGVILEVKYAADFKLLDKACETAMKQIKSQRYDEYLRNEDRNSIWAYGIAFYKKRCKIIVEKL